MSLEDGASYTFGTVMSSDKIINLSTVDKKAITLQVSDGGGSLNQVWTAVQDTDSPTQWCFQNAGFPEKFLGFDGSAVVNNDLEGVVTPRWFSLQFNSVGHLRLDAAPDVAVQTDGGRFSANTPLVLETVATSGRRVNSQHWVVLTRPAGALTESSGILRVL